MKYRNFVFPVILLLAVCAGCASSFQATAGAGYVPLGKEYETSQPSPKPPNIVALPSKIDKTENPTGTMSLPQALALGLLQSPELAVFSWDIRAAEARKIQAGLWPNPEFSMEVENFGGNKEMLGFSSAETTVQISQLFELGGKRAYRQQTAELEKNLAGWEYEIKRRDLFEKISVAFWEVLAAQERTAIAESLLKLATQVHSAVAEQVKVGKAPPLEEVQANNALTTTTLQFQKTKCDLEVARSRLAETLGIPSPTFEKAAGQFDAISPTPELDNLYARLAGSPEMIRRQSEVEKRQAEVRLKDAEAIPDITASAGLRYFHDNNAEAFGAGLSVPMPLFHRNQGERQEARHNVRRAQEEQKSVFIQIRSELTQAYQRCSSAFSLAVALRDKSIPGARQVFEATQEGYRQGKFSYFMVLDAERTLFELNQQYIDTLADYHTSRVTLERLTSQTVQ
jgi:cobalt-zinc-cadmium efflux system outer membrane protein